MNINYMNALRKRTDEVCAESTFENNLTHMFSDFYDKSERLRKTCRIVWDSFLKGNLKDANKNTLTYFVNPSEMEEVLRTFLSFLLASKKVSINPLSFEEIKHKWESGGDLILSTKVFSQRTGWIYRKSYYKICGEDLKRYKESGGCWCTQILGGRNRAIKVNPQEHLVFPSQLTQDTQVLKWPVYLCCKEEVNCFQEHTALSTPVFIFDRGGTAKNVLSSIEIDGVSAWEYFSVVEVRRDGDIRNISSTSTPSIFIFSDIDQVDRFLGGQNGKFAERFDRVIALFYDTDQLFPAAANGGLELQIAIRPLTDVLERGFDGRFSPDRFSGLQARGIVFSDDDAEEDVGDGNEVHIVNHKSIESEWSAFYDLMRALKRFSDNDILFSVFCMARAIFNQLRQPVFEHDRCSRLAHELSEKAQSFRQQFGDVDEANQAIKLSGLIKNILEQDSYPHGVTEKLDAIREFAKTLPEADRSCIALAGRHDWIHEVIERELLLLGVNVVAKQEAKMLIHFKRQKKYHRNSDWIFPDMTVRNVWFLFEDEHKELESIKRVYRHLASVGIIDRGRKNNILGFELPTRIINTHTSSPDVGKIDVLTTEQILSTFDPNAEYAKDIYSSRIGAAREFTPQLYRELKFESGCRAELTRWTEVIVERENLRKLVSPSELQIGDNVWMMLYDEMVGVSAHGFDDGATLKNRWVGVLSKLLKTRYEGDIDRLVDGVNNELRRQRTILAINRNQVKYWLKGCTLRPDGAENLFKALGILSGDVDLQKMASELAYTMSRVNASHQSIGKKVSESFKDAIIRGRTKVIVGQKEFNVEKYFSKQIIREILDYDDQDDDPEDDVSNKGPFNYLIK